MFYNIFLLLLVSLVVIIAFKQNTFDIHDFDRDSSISLKGILAICVVIRHLFGICFQIPNMIPLGYYSVILFFFCAGYGLMFQLELKGSIYLMTFFKERWLKVCIPFCIATLIYGSINNFILCHWGGKKCISLLDLLNGETILPYSWFAVIILLYYIVFYICANLYKNKIILAVSLFSFTIIYIYIVGIKLAWGGYWINSILAINVGVFFQMFEMKIKETIKKHHKICSLFLLCIMFFFLWIIGNGFWIDLLLCCVCIPIIVVFSVYYLGMINNTITKCLGKYSYEIYLTHGTILVLYSQFENTFINKSWFTVFAAGSIAVLSLFLKKVSIKINKKII